MARDPQLPTDPAEPPAHRSGTAAVDALEVAGGWRTLLDSLSEGVSLATEDGTIVYTNPAEDELFGYPRGGLVGLHVSVQNAYPPEQNARVVAEVIAQLNRTGNWTGDWLNRRGDGSVFTTSSRISRVEVRGEPHWLCVQADVTHARQTAEALAASEARLELATEAAGLGIWDWDLLTGRMSYSPRARAICGLSRDQPVTIEAIRAIVHPDDYPFTSAQLRRALDPVLRERAPYEYRLVRPDRTERRVLAHGEAVFAEIEGVTRATRYAGTIQDVTERWRLQETERATARRLQLAVDAGRMAVWEVDIVADTVIVSPALNRMLGFPEDAQPTLDELRAGYFPGEQQRLEAIGQAALSAGNRYIEAEYRYRCPDGTPKWLMLRCEILFGESGEPARAVGVLADITGRKRTEEELRISEARLALAQRAAGLGVWDWNVVEDRIEGSPEIFDILGLDPAMPPERLAGEWRDLVHPDDRPQVKAAGVRARSEGGRYATEYRVIRSDGETRWLRSRGTTVLDDEGRPVHVTGILSDITRDRGEQERLLSQARELQSTIVERTRERDRIFELSSDIFAVAGHDGWLRMVNPAFAGMVRLTQEQLLSRPFAELIHPEDLAASASALAELRNGQSLSRFENRLLAADGQVRWVSWTAVPEGDVFYAVGRDVTIEREREQQLRQAQKLEAIGQLTGGVAHDFNNLLMVFSAGLEMLERQADPGRRRAVAEGMRQAVTRGTSLTRQLLAFARRQALRPEPIDLAVRIGTMRDLLSRSLGSNVELQGTFPDVLWPAFADPGEFELAVVNLCVNARDAMPDGGQITISAQNLPGSAEGDFVRLTISDTGSGMTPEVLAHVFEPFYTTKEVGKGTGLGLPQVYGFAKQSGGHVEIRSEPGRGTEVALVLPRSAQPPEAAAPPAPSPSRRARGTVLLVEDDREVATLVHEMLTELGYQVVQTSGAEAALGALADGRQVDLMLSDVMMPGSMNGIELAREARRRRPGIRVLLISGYPGNRPSRQDLAGARLLPKPFTLQELATVLDGLEAQEPQPTVE